ncbi:MAG: hypothetical protein RJA07_965 [Bacteroidota bacterium]
MQYLVVDKTLDGGLGDVVYKDSCIVCGSDSLAEGNIQCIRHGNGKDWWLIARKYHSNLFYKILIDSSGVHKADTQSIGTPYMESSYFQGISSSSFYGNKLGYHFTPTDTSLKKGRLDIFDFDRCTGNLSHPIHQILKCDNDSLAILSLCFSPNGLYLYACDGYLLYQLNVGDSNSLAHRVKIARSDNTPTPSPSIFNQMKLGPDGKIYVSFYGSNYYMSVINSPDNAGVACNFVYKQLYFGGFSGGIHKNADGALPNNPNYALGKIDCGVGMEKQLAVGSGQLEVYPNPCMEKLVVMSNKSRTFGIVNTIEVTNLLGQKQNIIVERLTIENCLLKTANLPSGIYFIKATDVNGNVKVGKFVKQ